jgi:methionyl aminopeptidase
MAIIKNPDELANLRYSCRILMSCFEHVGKMVRAGVSCGDIDDFAIKFIRSYGGEPSFLGYDGFKYAVCSSINDEVAHGISPKSKIIPDNSLVKLDMGVNYKGMFSDSCRSYVVGTIDPKYIQMKDDNLQIILDTIKIVKTGTKLGDIGHNIDSFARAKGYGNVYELGGHGVGREVHEKPFVAHQGKKGTGIRLQENEVICIEPMFTAGKSDVIFDRTSSDGWTVKTKDGSWCAQHEHEILVTKNGSEILTLIKPADVLPIKYG